MKIDIHTHSKFSKDSFNRIERMIRKAKKRNFKAIAITDHDDFRSLKTISNIKTDIILIPGSEIKTDIGDLLCLFINKPIKSKEWNQVIREVHKQKGIVGLPHPYKSHKKLEEVAKKVDFIEAINARTRKDLNKKAKQLALKNNKPMTGSSDAHLYFEIGRAYTEIPRCKSAEDIKKHLIKGNCSPGGKNGNRIFGYLSYSIELMKKYLKIHH